MAKFIEIATTDDAGTFLVNADQILNVSAGAGDGQGTDAATKATIFQNGITSHIVFECSTGTGTALAKAIQSALTANPGGIKSKVQLGSIVIAGVTII
tara:strand:- start:326 stop:619 length:294 start_codon:yes stop_codon:yes gene_type:complete